MPNKTKSYRKIRKNKSKLRRRKFTRLHYKNKLVSKRRRTKKGGSPPAAPSGNFGVIVTDSPTSKITTQVLDGKLDNLKYVLKDVNKEFDKALTLIEKFPNNITLQCLGIMAETGKLKEMKDSDKQKLYKCVWTGIKNPDSAMGSYAMNENDYDELSDFFDIALKMYHQNNNETFVPHYQAISGNASEIPSNDDAKSKRDNGLSLGTSKFELNKEYFAKAPSIRVRVGRNIKGQPLPASLTLEQRINIENIYSDKLKKIGGGTYKSLTTVKTNVPDGEKINLTNKLTENVKKELKDGKIPVEVQNPYWGLVKKAEMFKSMSDDKYLAYAGIANHWPEGKGSYTIEGPIKKVVWIGEEDHLRIFAMGLTYNIGDIFKQLTDIHNSLGRDNFSWSAKHGYITSCPTNLGTGMRASVKTSFLNICPVGSTVEKTPLHFLLKNPEPSWPFKMSIRGGGGEHTPIGEDGSVDISPSTRYGLTEKDIIEQLWFGVEHLGRINKELGLANTEITEERLVQEIQKVNEAWLAHKQGTPQSNTSPKPNPVTGESIENVENFDLVNSLTNRSGPAVEEANNDLNDEDEEDVDDASAGNEDVDEDEEDI